MDYQAFLTQFEQEEENRRVAQLQKLNESLKLLPVRNELHEQVESFIKFLGLDNEWFCLSRFEKDQERQKLAAHISNFYSLRGDLIADELEGIV
ncbi:hypothetical protein HYW46_03065 [Candidatus Daviesbacteria bacterium]|nr:hypothetical protein [Candidatus Daviesbacteria bacterium]